jgi:signal transduction histidine kinase
VGQSLYERYRGHPTIPDHIAAALKGGSFWTTAEVGEAVYDTWFTSLHGPGGEVVGLVGVSTDVSEFRKLQKTAIQNDRVIALGTLAASVAHEINNPLTYVMANLQVLNDRLPATDTPAASEMRDLISDTMEGLERIRRIVQQAQMMAPLQLDEHDTVVDLEAAIEAALQLVKADIRYPTRVIKELTGKGQVRGDRRRVEQLFAHLLRNAAQSIVEPRAPRSKSEIRVVMRALPSERSLIEVRDTGCGIPAELQERVFQPFFTTRPVGQGTGLGLSVCAGIVTALGGEITFESEPGRGSLFRVVVPTVALSAQSPSVADTAGAVGARVRARSDG